MSCDLDYMSCDYHGYFRNASIVIVSSIAGHQPFSVSAQDVLDVNNNY